VNIYAQQAANRRRTWLIMAVFVALLVALGVGFDAAFLNAGGGVPVGSIAALAVGSASAAGSYYGGAQAVLRASGARPLTELHATADEASRLKLRQLDNIVDEMAIASGLPRPDVYVIPDSDPNAFATGRGPGLSSIAVTRGLLDHLDREELQGVVAHELSHIRNLDVRLMTIVAALAGAIALLADWSRRLSWYGGGRRRGRRDGANGPIAIVFLVVWIAAMVLAPIVSRVLAMMVSRKREFLADATAAELTRNPLGLARALEKIDGAAAPTEAIHYGSAHLCIADPIGRVVNLRRGRMADLLASHPPMPERIAALRAMAY
jgi:heat shock protein HtpX